MPICAEEETGSEKGSGPNATLEFADDNRVRWGPTPFDKRPIRK
jgi:hypothetical protein